MNYGILSIAIVWLFMYKLYFGFSLNIDSAEELLCAGVFGLFLTLALITRNNKDKKC